MISRMSMAAVHAALEPLKQGAADYLQLLGRG